MCTAEHLGNGINLFPSPPTLPCFKNNYLIITRGGYPWTLLKGKN